MNRGQLWPQARASSARSTIQAEQVARHADGASIQMALQASSARSAGSQQAYFAAYASTV